VVTLLGRAACRRGGGASPSHPPNHTTEYTGTHGVVKFDETVYGDDDAAAKIAGSNHRPVWIELRVTADAARDVASNVPIRMHVHDRVENTQDQADYGRPPVLVSALVKGAETDSAEYHGQHRQDANHIQEH